MTLRLTVRAVVAVVLVSLGGASTAWALPSTVESTYGVPGKWEVVTATAVDSLGGPYDLWHPAKLGADGFRHPLVVWANGTLTPTAHYARLLEHLATWGFVVAAPRDTLTGSGTGILAVVDDLVRRSRDPSSEFYGRLDATRVGAMGHSQGAYGVLSATLKSNGVIRTAVPINLPDLVWLNPTHVADLTQVRQPILIVGGGQDWVSTPAGLVAYLDQIPGAVAAALLDGGAHDAVTTDATAYLGYVTAWMMYQLQDDSYAATAFVGCDAEISTNTAWLVLLVPGTESLRGAHCGGAEPSLGQPTSSSSGSWRQVAASELDASMRSAAAAPWSLASNTSSPPPPMSASMPTPSTR